MLPEKMTNLTLYYSKKELLELILPLIIAFVFISFPFFGFFNNEEELPRIVRIIFPILGVIIILDIIAKIYKIFYVKAGIVFNNEGIISNEKDFPDIKWNEIKNIGIGLGDVFFIEVKSMNEYMERYGFFERKRIQFISFLTKKPIEREVGINLEKYKIEDVGLLEKQVQLMREEYLGFLPEEENVNGIEKEETIKLKLILRQSRKKPILRALSSFVTLILIASPLFNAFKYVIVNPRILLIALLVIGFVVVVNLVLSVYRIFFPKVGVVFNEKGIKIDDDPFVYIEWEEVAGMEIGRKKILYIKMKSIQEFWKKRSFITWRLLPLLERITNEPTEDEIEINLKEYMMKDRMLLKEKLESMKSQYLESTSS